MMENPVQTNPETPVTEPAQPIPPPQQPAPLPERHFGLVDRLVDVIFFLLGAVELLLGVNLFFRLFSANPGNPIVNVIYTASQPFILPFTDMFREPARFGFGRPVALLPETLIAMVVYMVVAWVMVSIIRWITDRR